jgi:hypothetical protein
MKKIILLSFLLALSADVLIAQVTTSTINPEFDPQLMPVAVDMDSSIQLIVSDFILAKSLKTQVPAIAQVVEVAPLQKNGKLYLAFCIRFKGTPSHLFYHNILLYKGLQEAYYISNQSVTCGSDCQDCKAGCECSSNGGCPPVSPVLRISDFPMAKTTLYIEK